MLMKRKTYVCDPVRNTACGKTLCFEHGGPCGTTNDVRCALRDLTGQPVEIIEEEVKANDRTG